MVVQFDRVAGEGKVRPEQAGAKYSLAVPPRVARVVLPGRHVFVDAIERRGDLRVVEEPDDYVPVLQPVLVVLLRDGCHRPRSYFLSIVPITPKLRGCRRPGARCCSWPLAAWVCPTATFMASAMPGPCSYLWTNGQPARRGDRHHLKGAHGAWRHGGKLPPWATTVSRGGGERGSDGDQCLKETRI